MILYHIFLANTSNTPNNYHIFLSLHKKISVMNGKKIHLLPDGTGHQKKIQVVPLSRQTACMPALSLKNPA